MEKSCLEVNSERLSILGYPVVLIGLFSMKRGDRATP